MGWRMGVENAPGVGYRAPPLRRRVPRTRAASGLRRPQVPTRASEPKDPPMPACYFDVDGTLVRTNLVHPTLFYLLN